MPAIQLSKLGQHIGDILAQVKICLDIGKRAGVQASPPDFIDVTVTVLVANGAGAITRTTVVDQSIDETVSTGEDDVSTTSQTESKINSGGSSQVQEYTYEADEV